MTFSSYYLYARSVIVRLAKLGLPPRERLSKPLFPHQSEKVAFELRPFTLDHNIDIECRS